MACAPAPPRSAQNRGSLLPGSRRSHLWEGPSCSPLQGHPTPGTARQAAGDPPARRQHDMRGLRIWCPPSGLGGTDRGTPPVSCCPHWALGTCLAGERLSWWHSGTETSVRLAFQLASADAGQCPCSQQPATSSVARSPAAGCLTRRPCPLEEAVEELGSLLGSSRSLLDLGPARRPQGGASGGPAVLLGGTPLLVPFAGSSFEPLSLPLLV